METCMPRTIGTGRNKNIISTPAQSTSARVMKKKSQAQTQTTIYDVANYADVSVSTVSRVLNEPEKVASNTRRSVSEAIRELRYRPNRAARMLGQESFLALGVALSKYTTAFQSAILRGIRARLDSTKTELLLYDQEPQNSRVSLSSFIGQSAIDGLLLTGGLVTENTIEELATIGIPIVFIGGKRAGVDCFYWEKEASAYLATEHLIKQGHQRIGMITQNRFGTPPKVSGYHRALVSAGIEPNELFVASGGTNATRNYWEEAGYEEMRNLMEIDPAITAVFAGTNLQAVGALRAIREAALSVPGDYAVVGYGDTELSRLAGLTSVTRRVRDIGYDAMDLLLRRVSGKEKSSPISKPIRPKLKVRRSSGKGS